MMILKDPCIVQGSPEWKELRKTKITATDVAAIMGLNPWKTALHLYEEKVGLRPEQERTAAMQRGIDLEETARAAFEKVTGITVFPRVIVKGWQMASLDGVDLEDTTHVEIKVGGKKLMQMARKSVIPLYYRCQVMWQIKLLELDRGNYFCYQEEPEEGILIPVTRDEPFIKEMVAACWQFYECLINRVPPTELVLI